MKSKDPTERQEASKAAEKIKKEQSDGWTREARNRLVIETQKGNLGNARQIREDMIRRRGGRLGKGNRGEVISATIRWQPGQYERIFGHD